MPAAASRSAVRRATSGGSGQAAARTDAHAARQFLCELREPGQQRGVLAFQVEVHGAAVLGRELQEGLGVAGRVRVQLRAASDGAGAHLERIPEQRAGPRPGETGDRPGCGQRHHDGRQLGEAAQGLAGLKHALERAESIRRTDAYVRAQRRGAMAELEQRGLGGAPLDVLRTAGHRAFQLRGEGAVAVGVRLCRSGEQQVAGEVDARALGEAARGADGLDPARAEPYVDGAAIGQPG